MCYSEELKREAGGFMVGDQWVLTGWKGMFVEGAKVEEYAIRHESPNYRFIMSPATGFRWDKIPAEPTVTYSKAERLVIEKGKTPRFYSMYATTYTYEFGKLMTDEHGFHLAATKDGAKNALGGYGASNGKHVFTKILALESAIQDNHAHVVMILEPGKEPTDEQIQEIGSAKYEKYVGKTGAMLVSKTLTTAGSYVPHYATSSTYGWVHSVPVSSAMLTTTNLQKIYGQGQIQMQPGSIWYDGIDEGLDTGP